MDSLDGLVLKGIHPSLIIDFHAKEIEQNQIIHGFSCLAKDIGVVNSVPSQSVPIVMNLHLSPTFSSQSQHSHTYNQLQHAHSLIFLLSFTITTHEQEQQDHIPFYLSPQSR